LACSFISDSKTIRQKEDWLSNTKSTINTDSKRSQKQKTNAQLMTRTATTFTNITINTLIITISEQL
jgi:hypothetical protein